MADQLLDNEQALEIGKEAARSFGMGVRVALEGDELSVALLNGGGDQIGGDSASLAGAVMASLGGLTWSDLPDEPREEVDDVD